MDAVWLVIIIAVCVLLAWASTRIDPHWVSKDGRRFVCSAQRWTVRGEPRGRWRETRVTVDDGGRVRVDEKHVLRRTSTFWTVVSRSESPSRGREVFVLSGSDEDGSPALLALRLPRTSRAATALQSLVTQ